MPTTTIPVFKSPNEPLPSSPARPTLRPYTTAPDGVGSTQSAPGAGAAHSFIHSAVDSALPNSPFHRRRRRESVIAPFAGRLGGNQTFVLDRSNPANAELLQKVPDAAPNLNLKEAFDPRAFRDVDLYKAAAIEFVGTLLLVYAAAWNSLSPNIPPPRPSPTSGVFSAVTFLGPLVGACINSILMSLLIYSFGAISGGHMNPLITLGTFFAGLTSLPRLVLYVAAQTAGGALAGLLLRASAGTRDFKVGGCFLFEDMGVSVLSAFTVELVGDVLLLVLAFGVGLDPRQREIFGPALGPILVGLAAGATALCMSFSRPGFGGPGMNPARCFGVFVGSRFPGWHWVHWVGPLAASMFHGIVYFLVPPVSPKDKGAPGGEKEGLSLSTAEAEQEKTADRECV
ncbi:uncharacterized protein Z518_09541 [Rhinocladiella mackenziei CBS 650.93]|uniref:Aquaporin n=1 Tax=Rhinocladiella mackenziei CBS 650.93 TaxID=1442369 RepID=A0A0D2I7I8_9EURO|nr:uncharacterized protein Z518_09541 [Rhinocladiella mackenziei CBS 650.93]KIX01814.1 hypothetical protein Z518_09541 [Rhinocladiella mackenziei CBS 650.93]